MKEEKPYFRDTEDWTSQNYSKYKYKSPQKGVDFNKNPYEDAFLNRFGQWMVLPKRKKVFFGLFFFIMTLAMLSLCPHLNILIMIYLFCLALVWIIMLVYKIIYNTQVHKYRDFENKSYIED